MAKVDKFDVSKQDDNEVAWEDLEDLIKEQNRIANEVIGNYRDILENVKHIEKYNKDLAERKIDPLDSPVMSLIGNDGEIGIRNAVIFENKRYLDKEKNIRRLVFENYNPIFYMKKGEYLSELIPELPHGLIDKKITGVGATTLEIRAKRNSIIVLPTRVIAQSKTDKENNRLNKEACLYVGSKDKTSVSKQQINRYLNDETIKYKKLLVVADSLKKVIEVFESRKEDVYRNYFLMVDEIDVLQSDSNFRPQLEGVIDYYFKFKMQRRCLVSATVQEFTHPKLKEEKEKCLVTITYYPEIPKRNIDLIYSNNIHKTVCNKIVDLINQIHDKKIIIAYNSISGILQIISLLDEKIKKYCGILCSESSEKEVGAFYTKLSNSKLVQQITFMTCAYFTGIDIEEKNCHLITVSNMDMPYAVLPLNKITQIHGRCRKGIKSDTIIYNTDNTFKGLEKETYRKELEHKAKKIIDLLHATDEMKKDDKTIDEVFKRIKHLIIEKAGETLFSNAPFPLVRIDIEQKDQIAYFNIDALCEKMEAYTDLYSHKNKLYYKLKENHNVTECPEEMYNIDIQQIEKEEQVSDFFNKRELEELIKAKENVLNLYNQEILGTQIDYLIRNSKRKVAEFYVRIKKHYKHIEIETLCDILLEISDKNIKAYRNINNALSFWALDDKHSFKLQVMEKFKTGQKYNSSEIANILNPIIQYHFFRTVPDKNTLGLFHAFFERSYTQGKYRIKGTNPLRLPNPVSTISENETQLNWYFEIKQVDDNNKYYKKREIYKGVI